MKHKVCKTKQSWLSSPARWSDKWSELYGSFLGAKFFLHSAPGFSFFPFVWNSWSYSINPGVCFFQVLYSNRGAVVSLVHLHYFQDSYIAPIFLCTSQSSGEQACVQSKYHKQNPSKSRGESTFKIVLGSHAKGSFLYTPLILVVHESASTSYSIFVIGLETWVQVDLETLVIFAPVSQALNDICAA